jgi:single-strand DNA-binding protein
MFSKLTLFGNLGDAPKLLTSKKTGKPFCAFSVAVNEGWGENKTTSWYSVTVHGDSAEAASKILTKGSSVWVEGRPSVRSYKKSDGTETYQYQVLAREWHVGGTRKSAEEKSQIDLDDLPY